MWKEKWLKEVFIFCTDPGPDIILSTLLMLRRNYLQFQLRMNKWIVSKRELLPCAVSHKLLMCFFFFNVPFIFLVSLVGWSL